MAIKIAFLNGKGGCGKSTSLFHIAGVLSKSGKKVLVIDLDKQCNSTDTFLMHCDYNKSPDYGEHLMHTVYDALLDGDISSHFRALFPAHGNARPAYFGVNLLCGDVRLENEAKLQEAKAEKFSESIDSYVAQENIDYVLVDMPPSNKTLNEICLGYLVDHVIAPFSSDIHSVSGYGDIMDTIQAARVVNPTLNIVGVFLARYMANCSVDRYIREKLLSFETFIDIQIPLAADVREGVMFGRPISYYKKESKSRSAYESLVGEINRKVGFSL
ncbi:MAG: ParA family protein [Oscillospiraceae bacterium]|nr:ParA family protein [Oscillospiraceae bacterium]MCL2277913.1 ParA family protein [Oscillospiraceae bacterium]